MVSFAENILLADFDYAALSSLLNHVCLIIIICTRSVGSALNYSTVVTEQTQSHNVILNKGKQ